MYLTQIDIVNFKNIAQASLEFAPVLNCLTGLNGMGKSNLLEAIHFLCMARGMHYSAESALIRHGSDALIVKGNFENEGQNDSNPDTVACGITRGKGKKLKCNGKEYSKISEHIGRFPVVTVSPSDLKIIEGGAEERRRLMDMVISQGRPDYLSHLIRYNRALETRNSLLRQGIKDPILFESVETAMDRSAREVYDIRNRWVNEMSPLFESFAASITSRDEHADIDYKSLLSECSFKEVLESNRSHDQYVGYTTKGIHRDDIEMRLDGRNIRRLGSQGQLKTFTIALRLAIFEYLRRICGNTPILLLDDIFDRLDTARVENLMHLVSSNDTFGQIFITDTDRRHIDTIIRSLGREHKIWKVDNGRFSSF